MLENELYEPMRGWLEQYLNDKYKGYDIIAVDTSQERLDRALSRYGIVYEAANGVDIQIDVLGIARKNADIKLFFIVAKKTRLTPPPARTAFPNCERVSRSFLFVR